MMYRILAFVFVFVTAATTFAVAEAPPKSESAPADEYFGRMKMSIMGIRNELNVLDTRIKNDPTHGDANLKVCELVEDSLEEWAQRYPRDSWLQASFAHLEVVYGEVLSLDGRLHLARLVLWIHEHLSGSATDNDTSLAAAKLFEVPFHSADAAPSPAPSPNLLDPTQTPPPDVPRSVRSTCASACGTRWARPVVRV